MAKSAMYIRGLGWVSVDDSELVEPAASEAEGVEITDSIRKEIEDHVIFAKFRRAWDTM